MEDVLNCPACGNAMIERDFGRTQVNQCPDGHGVFLARADLGDLIDAENDWHRDGGAFHTAPMPRITEDMTAPPRTTPKAPAWIATLFT
ncbi:MAG: zf-TFIIB domain-containing protein [Nocardioides sp.]|nr:zf-TFIIB domain-containing protein [Nocardioides sp.]